MNFRKLALGGFLATAILSGCAFAAMKGEISVLSREEGSGTRGAFIELFGIERADSSGKKIDCTSEDADVTNSTSVMMTSVAGNPNAIGYVSMGSLNSDVKSLVIDGASATAENVKNGTYKAARPFVVVTKGNLSAGAKSFLNFIVSGDGQKVIEKNGYIAVAPDANSFAAQKVAGKVVVAGSSSVTPVMEKLKEAYAAFNPDAEIEVQQSDSTTGVNAAISGICDLGMASRELKDSEKTAGAEPTVIAMDGIAVIVNVKNPVDELSAKQVGQIFTGEIEKWEDLD